MFLLLLSSCKVGKNYQRPELNLPDKYREDESMMKREDTVIYPVKEFFKNPELVSLLDIVLNKNSNLLLAIKNIDIAESTLGAAKLNYLPDLTAQINGSYSSQSNNSAAMQVGGSREIKDYNLSIGITWDVDIWGKIRREKEEALANYLQSHEAKKTVQTRLVADVAKGYYNLLMLDEQYQIAIESKELSERTLNIVKLQYQVGEASMIGVQQVEAQLEQNKVLLSQIENSISIQENALSLLCGNYAKSIKRTRIGNEFGHIPVGGYPVSLLANRPDVRVAELSLKAANARVGIALAAMYPSLTINPSGGLNSMKESNWFSIPASLFGTLAGGITQPIFNRGRLKANYKQMQLERDKSVISFRQSVIEAYAQVSDAMRNKQELEKQYLFALKRENIMKESIKSTDVLFRAGEVNYLEVINVQSNFLQSSLQSSQIYTEKMQANIELYYALGGGWQ
ncbi:MAG: efflux transporter outer membrane subunit [Dysgonomonas sp.]